MGPHKIDAAKRFEANLKGYTVVCRCNKPKDNVQAELLSKFEDTPHDTNNSVLLINTNFNQ